MTRFKIVGTFILGAALTVPAGLMAFQNEESTKTTTTTTETHRYYDSGSRQYHDWDSNEDRAYRTYLREQHREYTEFPKATREQQTEYWKWRHDHPNSVIFKSETHTEEQK